MIKNNSNFDSIVTLKKFIIEQLTNSQDLNMEYKFCLDFLHNHKDENYKKFIVDRTGKPASEVFKIASKFIQETNSFIFTSLESLTEEQRASLINEPAAMSHFLSIVNEKIKGGSNGLFISGTKCD